MAIIFSSQYSNFLQLWYQLINVIFIAIKVRNYGNSGYSSDCKWINRNIYINVFKTSVDSFQLNTFSKLFNQSFLWLNRVIYRLIFRVNDQKIFLSSLIFKRINDVIYWLRISPAICHTDKRNKAWLGTAVRIRLADG